MGRVESVLKGRITHGCLLVKTGSVCGEQVLALESSNDDYWVPRKATHLVQYLDML